MREAMFREDKATQMAAQFIEKKGGRIEYLHLLKLMYEADKQTTLRYGMPITFDTWIAMRNGPLLSTTYDIIREPGSRDGYWQTFIQKQGYDVVLTHSPGNDELSEVEEEVIDEVFEKYGRLDQWHVVDLMHQLPEWKSEWNDPNFNSSATIEYDYVLRINGATEEHIDTVHDNLATQEMMASLVSGK